MRPESRAIAPIFKVTVVFTFYPILGYLGGGVEGCNEAIELCIASIPRRLVLDVPELNLLHCSYAVCQRVCLSDPRGPKL